jgi:hypothetical protein
MSALRTYLFAFLTALTAALGAVPLGAQSQRDIAQSSEPFVYQVDRLENGGGAGTPLELDTPMGLVETFMAAGEAREWTRASAALDFANLDGTDASQRDVTAALYDLLERSVAIDWAVLPDRPDAVDTETSSKDPMAGTPRRSITLAEIETEGRSVPIRIARVQAPGGEPVWVFSRQTVANVPALYETYGPTRFEKALPPFLREQAFWTLAWWEVIALPLILIVFLLSNCIQHIA